MKIHITDITSELTECADIDVETLIEAITEHHPPFRPQMVIGVDAGTFGLALALEGRDRTKRPAKGKGITTGKKTKRRAPKSKVGARPEVQTK
jgi:hypothetical protein